MLTLYSPGHLREGRQERYRIDRQEEVPGPGRPHRGTVRLRHPEAYQVVSRKGHLHLHAGRHAHDRGADAERVH